MSVEKKLDVETARKLLEKRDPLSYDPYKHPPLPEGHLSQSDLRALIYGVFLTYLLPIIKGKTVHTGEVMGHDEEVSNTSGTILRMDLLEGEESDVIVTIDIPGYGEADVLLEELLNEVPKKDEENND